MTMNDEPRPPLVLALLAEKRAADLARRQAEERAAAETAARRADIAEHNSGYVSLWDIWDFIQKQYEPNSSKAHELLRDGLKGSDCKIYGKWITDDDHHPPDHYVNPKDIRYIPLPSGPVCHTRKTNEEDHRLYGYITSPCPDDRINISDVLAVLEPIADILSITKDDAHRVFGFTEEVQQPATEPTSAAQDHPEDAREMVTAPSASPPAPADPVAPPAGAAARPEAPAAAQSPAAPRGVVRNSASRKRADPLGAVFRRAKQEATDPTCPHSVWAALMALAAGKNPPPELTDFDDEKGIQATGARNGWLSKDAFIERWRRGTV